MKWSSSLLAGACAISLLAACAPMAPSVPQSRLSEDPAELDKIRAATQLAQTKSSQPDAQAAQVFLVNNPLIVQPAMQRELAAIAGRLLDHWTATPAPQVNIFIVPDSSYGGDAAGPNDIFINTGTLERAGSEDEIAFVIAHELAHILRGHISERQSGVAAGNGMINFASEGTMLGVVLAHAGQAQLGHGATGAVLAAFQIGQIFLAANQSAGSAEWSRAQEYEADSLGLDLLIKSGYYNPAAFNDAFERLIAESKFVEQRKAELKGTVAVAVDLAMAYALGGNGGGASPLSKGASAALVAGFMSSPTVEKLISKLIPANLHPPEADRLNHLKTYLADVWPEVAPGNDDKANPFTEGVVARQAAPVFQAVQVADAADGAITAAKLTDARGLIAKPALGAAMPLQQSILRAKLSIAQGNDPGAVRLLQRVTRGDSAPASAYTLLADVQASTGKVDDALATLDAGQTRFGSDAGFLPYRITILREAGRSADMNDALQKCAALNIPDVETACQKAASPPKAA